ncbi:hypothetical protein APSETT445_008286 [Aspergillus pseudonomiae]
MQHRDHKHQLHGTQPTSLGHDLGMLGVLLHVVSDAANNLGVMTAALVIWLAHYEGRYYADPGTTIHELHIWRLNQHKTLASVHVVVSDPSVENFAKTTKTMNECFHAYGIHSATLQPEACPLAEAISTEHESAETMQELRKRSLEKCQVLCGTLCEELTCFGL